MRPLSLPVACWVRNWRLPGLSELGAEPCVSVCGARERHTDSEPHRRLQRRAVSVTVGAPWCKIGLYWAPSRCSTPPSRIVGERRHRSDEP